MPRLIPPELGNGRRPSDPGFRRSTLDTAIPVLDVSDETHALIGDAHAAAVEDDDKRLTGAVLVIDNPSPAGAPDAVNGNTVFRIGGSTLHEAATEVVGAYSVHGLDMPEWVASTDADLAAVIAEHFTVKGYSKCVVKDLEEVLS